MTAKQQGKKKKQPRDLNEERGEYRPIYTVLIHGPDYQALAPKEKLVLIHLKLNLGPAGIGVLYSGVLAEQTGYSDDQVALAIDILSHRGWVSHERNVFWVIEGLRFEPSLSKKNENHCGWVARYLKGLPKLNIVKQFADYYREWLPLDWDGMGDGIHPPMPITTTSTTTSTTTETTTKTKPIPDSHESAVVKSKKEPKYPNLPLDVSDRLWEAWEKTGRHTEYPVFRKRIAEVYPRYSESDILSGIEGFHECSEMESNGKAGLWTIHQFVGSIGRWVEWGKMKATDSNGAFTKRGLAIFKAEGMTA